MISENKMENPTFNNKKILGNFLWRFLERVSAQVISFVVTIVLARILAPEAFGTVAIITVITSIMQVFVDGGFGNALIQKRDVDDYDFSTVFVFNLFFCLIVYTLLFLLAPSIAFFYQMPELTAMLRVAAIIIIISGIKNIQQTYVSKHFLFRKFFYATIGGTAFSAIVGIVLALNGFGAWALILQQLSNTLVDTIVLWCVVPWRPKKIFSLSRLREMFSYGYKLLLTSLLNSIYSNFRQLLIGKFYSSSELAFYNRGKQFPFLVVTNVNASLDSVLFPAMSSVQKEENTIKKLIEDAVGFATFVMWPILVIMAGAASSLVPFLLTSKWIGAIPYLRIFCFVCMTFPVQTANLNAIKAKGRSEICLKIQLLEAIIGISLILLVVRKGTLMVAIMYLATSVITTVVVLRCSYKVCGYNIISQIKNIFPNLISSIAVYLSIGFISTRSYLTGLVLQILIGIIVYIFMSKLQKVKYLDRIIIQIRGFLKGKSE